MVKFTRPTFFMKKSDRESAVVVALSREAGVSSLRLEDYGPDPQSNPMSL